MVKLIGMLSQLSTANILVIGDFMLDTYTTGKVRRVSPEAPVSVLHVQNEESRPGGSGNVVLNLVSLGASVVAVGRVGKDRAGGEIITALNHEGVDTSAMFVQENYKTPVKNRLIADAQQVLRVDFEDPSPIPEILEQEVINKTLSLLDKVQIVAVSDYGKGFLSRLVLRVVIQNARKRKIPVIIDPKGIDFAKYRGATILKPNLSEAYAAAKLPPETPLDQVGDVLLQTGGVDMLLITRSEAGMSLFTREGQRIDFPVQAKEVKDVTGAGDTVLALISLALANGLDITYAAQIANIAGALAIERLGCARINMTELSDRLLEHDSESKVFDVEHLFALEQALRGKSYTVLGVDSRSGITTPLFKSIKKLSSHKEGKKLIIYVKDNDPDEEVVSLLSSLAEVDFIVLKTESLKNLWEIIHPQESYLMDKDELIFLEHPSLLLEEKALT